MFYWTYFYTFTKLWTKVKIYLKTSVKDRLFCWLVNCYYNIHTIKYKILQITHYVTHKRSWLRFETNDLVKILEQQISIKRNLKPKTIYNKIYSKTCYKSSLLKHIFVQVTRPKKKIKEENKEEIIYTVFQYFQTIDNVNGCVRCVCVPSVCVLISH